MWRPPERTRATRTRSKVPCETWRLFSSQTSAHLDFAIQYSRQIQYSSFQFMGQFRGTSWILGKAMIRNPGHGRSGSIELPITDIINPLRIRMWPTDRRIFDSIVRIQQILGDRFADRGRALADFLALVEHETGFFLRPTPLVLSVGIWLVFPRHGSLDRGLMSFDDNSSRILDALAQQRSEVVGSRQLFVAGHARARECVKHPDYIIDHLRR